jgi:hypothetical protein
MRFYHIGGLQHEICMLISDTITACLLLTPTRECDVRVDSLHLLYILYVPLSSAGKMRFLSFGVFIRRRWFLYNEMCNVRSYDSYRSFCMVSKFVLSFLSFFFRFPNLFAISIHIFKYNQQIVC